MKFAYIDESGTGNEPFAVMAAVIVDAQRMRQTKDEWDEMLSGLSILAGLEVKEFHTRDFYAGNKPWRGIKGDVRAAILTLIFEWFQKRKHRIIFSAIDRRRFDNDYKEHKYTQDLGSLWKVLATHLALSIQRAHQTQGNNKGNTVLIFDRHDQDQKDYAGIILQPPEWTDTYYSRGKKQKQLDQIVDVPHFVDSEHVGMIQVADCISYFLRRNLELTHAVDKERYDGEAGIIEKWAGAITDRCHSMASMYPKKGRCEAAEYFYQLAPDGIK